MNTIHNAFSAAHKIKWRIKVLVFSIIAVMLSRMKRQSSTKIRRSGMKETTMRRWHRKAFQALILMNSFICVCVWISNTSECFLYRKCRCLRLIWLLDLHLAMQILNDQAPEIFIFTNKIATIPKKTPNAHTETL